MDYVTVAEFVNQAGDGLNFKSNQRVKVTFRDLETLVRYHSVTVQWGQVPGNSFKSEMNF